MLQMSCFAKARRKLGGEKSVTSCNNCVSMNPEMPKLKELSFSNCTNIDHIGLPKGLAVKKS